MILTNELAVEMETKVSFIVNKYASSYNREDLMQAGKMGVIKAANNFDPMLGIKFSTFCEKYIFGHYRSGIFGAWLYICGFCGRKNTKN